MNFIFPTFSYVWFVILGGFHQEDLRSNRGTMLAVELLKNHVILLTWSCKQPLNGVPNSLDQISCQWRFLMKH
ncbi:unnamed protein product [Brassica oleracea var. botrytis]|uniref:Uncharacterized protein n=2 Tax=Brassica TaxID=3705 RepID=A0A8D9DU50_BRACM|nr:unnamed protein product [Brassica napus]CAG7879518.1 unnamed protein product [Brassica rapa]